MSNRIEASTCPVAPIVWSTRVALVLGGLLATFVGLGPPLLVVVASLFSIFRARPDAPGLPADAALALGLVLLVLLGLGAHGVALANSGLRGRTVGVHPRVRALEGWLLRYWYPVALLFWGALTALVSRRVGGMTELLLGGARTPPNHPGVVLIFLAIVLLPGAVLVHELGHAIGAAAMGARFQRLRVGWLTVRRSEGRLEVDWARAPSWFTAGEYLGSSTTPARTAVQVAAGPAASLAMAWLTYRAVSVFAAPTTVGQAILEQALWVCAGLGLLLGGGGLVPLRKGGSPSDGALLLDLLLRRPHPGKVFLSAWDAGQRPRDWGLQAADFLRAAEAPGPAREAMFLAALCVALDRGEEQEAEVILQRALSTGASPELPFRFELELQGAMLSAFQGRPGLAREHLGRVGPHATTPWYPRLAEAVVAAARGELAAAREALDVWESSRQSSPDPARLLVGNQWARDRLEALLGAEGQARPQSASAQEATRVG